MPEERPLTLDAARRRLLLAVGPARFVRFGEVEAGQMTLESSAQTYQYVGLYHHRIGNQFRVIGGHAFIISNGFLASHAYNLALAHLFLEGAPRPAALGHNYKKFFAECVLGMGNALIGRALLLETILFEQEIMRPIFDSIAADGARRAAAEQVAGLMSMLLSQHELAHYQEHRAGRSFRAEASEMFGGGLERHLTRIEAERGVEPANELLCDAVSAWLSLSEGGEKLAGNERLTRLRMIAFGFLCFADLTALQKSADLTLRQAREEDQSIALGSELRPRNAFGYTICRDPVMDLRAAAIVDLLREDARANGMSLFGEDGEFPLAETIADELKAAFETFADESTAPLSGLTGTDLARRQLAQLVAESLHGHDKGVEHLLWRSKQFSVGGEPVDP